MRTTSERRAPIPAAIKHYLIHLDQSLNGENPHLAQGLHWSWAMDGTWASCFRSLSRLAAVTAGLFFGMPALAVDPAATHRIAISVESADWGTARPQQIEKVLTSVTEVLLPYFPQRASDRIVIGFSQYGPRVLPEKTSAGAYRVLLNVRDTRWDQFAYQFSHELCHVFTNFEHREISRDTATRDHQWFEETLCEAVSLFALKQMGPAWDRSPPYPGWQVYAPAFSEYADRLLSERQPRTVPDESIAAWYRANREDLARNPYLRDKNEQLATRLLPLIENTPGNLRAIAYLNLERSIPPGGFGAYLESWYSCCPEEHRAFVVQVMSLLGERNTTGQAAVASAL